MASALTVHMTTYYDSAEDIEISFARALDELVRHGFTSPIEQLEIMAQLGPVRETYSAQEVLQALGY